MTLRIIDAKGNQWDTYYNENGQLVMERDPEGYEKYYGYDAVGIRSGKPIKKTT